MQFCLPAYHFKTIDEPKDSTNYLIVIYGFFYITEKQKVTKGSQNGYVAHIVMVL